MSQEELYEIIKKCGGVSAVSFGDAPALLKKSGEIIELSTNDPSLGILEGAMLQEKTIHLEKGDELLLYTDGAIEAQDPEGRLFGSDQLKAIFLHAETTQDLLDEIETFSATAAQHDDLTLLQIKLL